MTIDTPRREDILRLRQLWQKAFGDTEDFLDGFFTTGFSQDRCRCLKENGQLAAALYWFDCSFEDKKFAYIYAVATDAAFRGKGLCRMLMEDTHAHLKQLGYTGAVLVPGDRGLFRLYEKLGYQSFCPMRQLQIQAGEDKVSLQQLTPKEYGSLRRQKLPVGGILQEGVTLRFLETFTQFYSCDDGCFCAVREDITVYFQEHLGRPELLPEIIAALGGENGVVYLPGDGPDRAMYLLFENCKVQLGYLGLALN